MSSGISLAAVAHMAEQVIIFTGGRPSAPVCATAGICTAAGMAREIPAEDPGVVARADGNVVRITGLTATFAADGLPV